ncbi:hypothetical protein F5X71_05490 [Nocardia brasiliensis]|uniref:Uncharacterized protein n=1 Tax=Nocardia brasiliensis TaxID=37326 RepID=A0A6G9XLU4_NOCBR|nr:hypothetical protein [Nocardia brasiliensis]QIS01843.1 hypothetical protein F5X71_05490 [Nocardia brasiliensis]
MTSARIDRRVRALETRVTDIEDTHSESLYELRRRVTGIELVQRRSFALLLRHIGVPATDISAITVATEDDIDADC